MPDSVFWLLGISTQQPQAVAAKLIAALTINRVRTRSSRKFHATTSALNVPSE